MASSSSKPISEVRGKMALRSVGSAIVATISSTNASELVDEVAPLVPVIPVDTEGALRAIRSSRKKKSVLLTAHGVHAAAAAKILTKQADQTAKAQRRLQREAKSAANKVLALQQAADRSAKVAVKVPKPLTKKRSPKPIPTAEPEKRAEIDDTTVRLAGAKRLAQDVVASEGLLGEQKKRPRLLLRLPKQS